MGYAASGRPSRRAVARLKQPYAAGAPSVDPGVDSQAGQGRPGAHRRETAGAAHHGMESPSMRTSWFAASARTTQCPATYVHLMLITHPQSAPRPGECALSRLMGNAQHAGCVRRAHALGPRQYYVSFPGGQTPGEPEQPGRRRSFAYGVFDAFLRWRDRSQVEPLAPGRVSLMIDAEPQRGRGEEGSYPGFIQALESGCAYQCFVYAVLHVGTLPQAPAHQLLQALTVRCNQLPSGSRYRNSPLCRHASALSMRWWGASTGPGPQSALRKSLLVLGVVMTQSS